jgi:transposase-like protein
MKTRNAAVSKVLKRLHYPLEVILMCVRWYVAHPLSLRHLEPIFSQHQVPGEVMLGLKRFSNAAITLAGIELMHRIRKGQFNLAGLRLKRILLRRLCRVWSCRFNKMSCL